MKNKRSNPVLEAYRDYKKLTQELAEKEQQKINEQVEKRNEFMKQYDIIREIKKNREQKRSQLLEAARDEVFSTVMKAIYITALEAETLTDDGIILAEDMVDNWIRERGGASKILTPVCNNTYLLSRISQIVDEEAEEIVKDLESEDNEDTDDSTEEKKDDAVDKVNDFIQNADKEEVKELISDIIDKVQDKSEEDGKEQAESDGEPVADNDDNADGVEKTEDDVAMDPDAEEKPATDEVEDAEETDTEEIESDETEEETEDNDDETPEEEVEDTDTDDDTESEEDDVELDSDEDSDTDEDLDDDSEEDEDDEDEFDSEFDLEDEEEEDEEEDEAEEIEDELDEDEDLGDELDDDEIDADITVDGDIESNGKVFDDLDKEEDVQKAIDLIRSRVADAEETFIRNNAEDKKKIEELLDRISNNVKTVEDLSDKNPKKAKIAEQVAMENRRKISDITNNRPLTVFERMARIDMENIVKNENARVKFLTESGELDVDLVVERAKIMYGFLETINTLQIEKVDSNYIANILNNMN